jgi:hypothetical protein
MCTLDLCRYFGAQMELNYNIVTLYTKHLSFLFTYIHIYIYDQGRIHEIYQCKGPISCPIFLSKGPIHEKYI